MEFLSEDVCEVDWRKLTRDWVEYHSRLEIRKMAQEKLDLSVVDVIQKSSEELVDAIMDSGFMLPMPVFTQVKIGPVGIDHCYFPHNGCRCSRVTVHKGNSVWLYPFVSSDGKTYKFDGVGCITAMTLRLTWDPKTNKAETVFLD